MGWNAKVKAADRPSGHLTEGDGFPCWWCARISPVGLHPRVEVEGSL